MSGLGSMIDLVEICGRSLVDRKDSGGISDPHAGLGESSDPPAEPPSRGLDVRRVIEAEIVPRLLLSHAPAGSSSGLRRTPNGEDVAELARIVVAHDLSTARAFIEALESSDVDREGILLDLLAPTARLLGELWAADRCTFAEVSMGLSKLQTIALELSRRVDDVTTEGDRGHVLLAPVPGEQHTLGLRLVTDLLRADGWCVTDLNGADRAEIVRQVSQFHYDVVGLTISNNFLLDVCRELVVDIRRASIGSDPLILIGGSLPLEPSDVEYLGADMTASDGRELVRMMQKHHERMSPQRDAVHD